jgi:hypothetical protein
MTNYLFAENWSKQPSRLTDHVGSSVDKNLKSHPDQFWKYVSTFRKTNTDLIQLEINGILINKFRDIAEAFSKHFQSVYSSSYPGTIHFTNKPMKVLSSAPISNSDVYDAIKRLWQLNQSESTVYKGLLSNFTPVIKFIFNLSLSQNTFPALWKQAVIVYVLKKKKKKGKTSYLEILNNFSKVF